MFNFKPKADDGAPKQRIGAVTATRILKFADKGLLGAFIGAVIAVYILDAIFFMAWAPNIWLVPVFFLIGIVIRSTGVFSGPIMQVVAKDSTVGREAKTIRALSIAAGVLCLIPALSFFAGGHYNQTHASTVAAATTVVSDTNKVARIARLEQNIKDEEKARDDSIAEANKTIEAIVHDDVPGISAADNVSIANLRTEIQTYRTDANAKIAGFRSDIGTIEAEKEGVQTENAEKQEEVSPAYAIFKVLGGLFGSAEGWAMVILFIFAILVEAIAFFGLGAYQGLHKFFIEAIQTMELNEAAHEARLAVEAQRIKDKIAAEAILERANADLELAAIEAAARRARERAEAARNGEDPELLAPVKAAEADLKAAGVEEQAAKLRREAADIRGRVTVAPVQPVTVEKPAEEELVLTDAQRRGRAGGLAAAQARAAAKARDGSYVLVPSLVERDQQQAMKVAAE